MRLLVLIVLIIAPSAAAAQPSRDQVQASRDLDEDLGPGVFRDCATCPEMKELPAGTAPAFAIGRFEITRDQFGEFVRATGHKAPPNCAAFPQRPDHPVICVSKADAADYAAWLTKITGHTYRLPSAAQWDYAARAGSATAVVPRAADATAPVGLKPANAWGLYDLEGNVAEWTASAADGGPQSTTGFRVAAEVK